MKLCQRYTLILVSVTAILAYCWFVFFGTSIMTRQQEHLSPLLAFFNTKDPIDIGWEQVHTLPPYSPGQDSQMISVDAKNMDTVKSWLHEVRRLGNLGLKFHFQELKVLKLTLEHLAQDEIPFPVVLHVNLEEDIFETLLNFKDLFHKAQIKVTALVLSVDLSSTSSSLGVEMEDVQETWEYMKQFNCSKLFAVSEFVVKRSWSLLRWLLQQADDTFVSVVSDPERTSSTTYVVFDLLYVRADWPDRVYFELADIHHFRSSAHVAGSPLQFFDVDDALHITWAHAVNSREQLDLALKGDVMFLEADVVVKPKRESHLEVVMAHSIQDDSDLTLKEFLTLSRNATKGIKLDFKTIDALEPALNILASFQQHERFQQPIWLNADILRGPNADGAPKPVDPKLFLSLINSVFPEVSLSLGWKTGPPRGDHVVQYTKAMVKEMNDYAKSMPQLVTFPVRAAHVRASWKNLDWLLQQSRGYTLTVWTTMHNGETKDPVKIEDMEFLRDNTDSRRVYFDLPPALMPTKRR